MMKMHSKRNMNFIQLKDPDGIEAMQALTMKNAKAASLFYVLMHEIDKDNTCLIASMQVLADRLGCSVKTVQRSVKYLKDHLYIAVLKSGVTNVYVLNASVVWKTDANKRTEAQLNARVLLTLDEQDQDYQDSFKKKKGLRVVK